jgi:hypothetical protein
MASTTPTRQSWTEWVQARWPTAVALAVAALIFVRDIQTGEGVTALSRAALLLNLEYLVIAKLRRREASWPVIVALTIPLVVLGEQDAVDPAVVFSALALVVLVWGAADGQLRRPDPFRVQALGMLGFGALALAGLVLDPDLGRYVVAAAWFLHGIWDFVYFKLDTVVSRSYAEFCGVVDVLVAAGLAFAL